MIFTIFIALIIEGIIWFIFAVFTGLFSALIDTTIIKSSVLNSIAFFVLRVIIFIIIYSYLYLAWVSSLFSWAVTRHPDSYFLKILIISISLGITYKLRNDSRKYYSINEPDALRKASQYGLNISCLLISIFSLVFLFKREIINNFWWWVPYVN